jgi:hypothetical protein
MFKRLAKFRLFQSRPLQSWGPAPGLQAAMPAQGAMPANDNLANALRPRGARRIRPQALACRWSLIDGGMRLGCRWQTEPVVPSSPYGSGYARTNDQPPGRKRPGLAVTAPCKIQP